VGTSPDEAYAALRRTPSRNAFARKRWIAPDAAVRHRCLRQAGHAPARKGEFSIWTTTRFRALIKSLSVQQRKWRAAPFTNGLPQ
jgi:hypothetical protein